MWPPSACWTVTQDLIQKDILRSTKPVLIIFPAIERPPVPCCAPCKELLKLRNLSSSLLLYQDKTFVVVPAALALPRLDPHLPFSMQLDALQPHNFVKHLPTQPISSERQMDTDFLVRPEFSSNSHLGVVFSWSSLNGNYKWPWCWLGLFTVSPTATKKSKGQAQKRTEQLGKLFTYKTFHQV